MRGVAFWLLVFSLALPLTAFRNAPGALRYVEMADKYVAEGRTALALEYYSKAVALEPENPAHYVTRGFFLLKLKRGDEGVADFSTAIRLDPLNPSNYLARGLVYSELKKEKEADADFATACKMGSQDGCSFAAQQ